jgi:molybdopterin molybdotransferase
MLAAMLASWPVDVIDGGIVPDDLDTLTAALARAAAADVVVTIGGASVGDRDLVRPALHAAGATVDFWKVAMRPGKPLLAGRLGDAVALGLPGNPVSAFVTAELFLKALIAALGGASDPLPRTLDAALAADVPAGGPRAEYLRARFTDGRVEPILNRDSAVLGVLASADALLIREAHAPPARAGDLAQVVPLA